RGPRSLVARKPTALDFAQAAALPTPGLTALQAVKAIAPQEGDTVLIVGATGGVGSYTSTDVVDAVKAAHPAGIASLIDVISQDATSLGRTAQVLRGGGRVATPMNAATPETLGPRGV